MYNFKEKELGADFAKEKMADFKKLINAGRSFVVLSMPGVGVSYFLRFLAMQDFAHSPSLRSGASGRARFFHIDLYSLPTLNQDEFYKLLKTEVPPLKTLSEKESGKIVLIFSRFDQLKKEFDNQFLSNIQSLTTLAPGKIVLIFTSTKPLTEISTESLTGGNLNFYSEILYFAPYAEKDLRKLLTIEPFRAASDHLLKLSGGHYQLLQILRRSQKQQNLLLDQFVKLQLKGLIDYLDYAQRKTLQKIALRQTQGKLFEVDDYLLGVGMVKQSTSEVEKMRLHLGGVESELFTPLLTEYIKTNLPVKLPLKEAKLFKLLRKNMGNVVSKDEIFTEVWPARHASLDEAGGGEDAEATDWALDALIYRLRKHPFIQANGYIIESHKKVGYILVQV